MDSYPSRREALIAGVLAGSLSDGEQQELDQARAADPTIDLELEELREIIRRFGKAGVTWREEGLPAGLEARILDRTINADPSGHGHGASAPPSQG